MHGARVNDTNVAFHEACLLSVPNKLLTVIIQGFMNALFQCNCLLLKSALYGFLFILTILNVILSVVMFLFAWGMKQYFLFNWKDLILRWEDCGLISRIVHKRKVFRVPSDC